MNKINIPCAKEHLDIFIDKLQNKIPFSFVRFSDGEIEILRNRYLEINNGKTVFRGREFTNTFPVFDAKKFDPSFHQNIRKDLLDSALFNDASFFKGIPTLHNDALKDREFLLRLNGGFNLNMTFSDLFLNSNYINYRNNLVPLFKNYNNIYVIANFRAKPIKVLGNSKLIEVPDNFFGAYEETLDKVMDQLQGIEKGSLILSSASSLSNIIAYKLFLERQDITFIDIGTSINDLLSLDNGTREYHGDQSMIKNFFYKRSKRYNIKW
ncbi:MAG: hypothetical protein JKX76_15270 [Colwellia sp.]|nr:hypothetical protein [Colwellia sp.]